MTLTDVSYDPFNPAIIADPFPVYRALRDESPVYWAESSRSWVLSRHEDVQAALLKPAIFSSAGGILPSPVGGSSVVDSLPPILITLDPPRHDRLRALVSRGFTARRIAALEVGVSRVAAELLDHVTAPKAFSDFVSDFAGALPIIVIADLLGIPADDKVAFRTWTNHVVQIDPVIGATPEGVGAITDMFAYFAAFLEDRRTTPRDDLMSSLVHADIDGVRLTDEEVLGFCALLLLAGNETTTNLLSNTAVTLARHPDIRRRLAHTPDLIGPAVEEMLRFESPIQGLMRRLTEDVTLHGMTMSAGDQVLLLYGSANRDDRVFSDPDLFDITRRPDRHLAFGKGVHFCLGAALARMEARIGLTELLARGADWDVDMSAAIRLQSGPIRGFRSLPIWW